MLLAEDKRPTEAQELEIRKAIPSLREDILKVQREYNDIDFALAIIPPEETPDAHLIEQFERLKVRLNKTQDCLASHTKSISYGRHVPLEVLELIFRLCLPYTDYVKPNRLEAPLLLCQISSAWRGVALATPLLWCSLSLHLQRRAGAWKDFLNGWLGRAAQAPLSISFEGSPNQYFDDHIVKVLLKSAKRWRRLRFSIGYPCMMRLLNTSTPMLEILEIGVRGEGGGTLLPGLYVSSADAPRLRSLVLLGSLSDPARLQVPWGRLSQFHAAKFPQTPDKCLPFLAMCKNLTQCTIQLSAGNGLTALQVQNIVPVRLPRLCSLVVIGLIHQDAVSVFFGKVDLPVLDSLKLVNMESEPFNIGPQSSVVTLARKVNLRSLSLSGGMPLEGLFDTVLAIPSLREVIIDGGWKIPPSVQEALDMRE
ncbi:hypothetical protein B0H14DRAFT_2832147 [Mycena olivaceomarginata]|nr:hypothetical protein B0H14DRAFT_2832147 [Mycena olivaceomarginata]